MRLAVSILFLVKGLIEAAWVSRIPAIQEHLHADTAALGIALLGSAIGSIFSMPLAGWLLAHYNTRTVTITVSLLNCAALPLMAFAPTTGWLFAALLVYGASSGGVDVSINAEAIEVDRKAKRTVMASFHGLYSLGGMLGALAGSLIARQHIPPDKHLLVAAFVAAAIVLIATRHLSAAPVHADEMPRFALPPRSILGLGAITFCVLFGERAMSDWSGVYLVQNGATNAFAAIGYAVFSAMMTIGRFAGDRLIHRFGETRILQAGSAFAAIGLSIGLAVGGPAAGLFGFACVGTGSSVLVPILFRAAGRTPGVPPGVGIASVTTMGYTSFLVGPPLIGFAGRSLGLRAALVIIAIFGALVSLNAGRVLRARSASNKMR
jgi:predicted MFS family arabinose efflux permease